MHGDISEPKSNILTAVHTENENEGEIISLRILLCRHTLAGFNLKIVVHTIVCDGL